MNRITDEGGSLARCWRRSSFRLAALYYPDVRFGFVLGAVLVAGCYATPEAASSVPDGSGADAESCNCTPTNGACNAGCTITCAPGFGDCDTNLANGCETVLDTISNCGTCATECSCYGEARCINGACAGTAEPNGTPCSIPPAACTSNSPVCESLVCTCAAPTHHAVRVRARFEAEKRARNRSP